MSDWTQSVSRALNSLNALAFDVGSHRVSILDVLTFGLVATIIYLSARFANRLTARIIRGSGKLDGSQQALLQKLAGLVIVGVALLIGVDVLGINLAAFTIFSGALGLAIGFGLQKTFGNLIAGLILLMDRSVKPGDVIVVGETFGTITKIGVRAVSLVTRDGKEHLIPNERLMTDPVENWSYSSRNVRLRIPIGISYKSDLALAQRLMLQAAEAATRVLDDPAPAVWLKGFGNSAVEHEILVWIDDPEAGVGNVQSEILNILWMLFKHHDIELPFPQQDVHVRTWPLPVPDTLTLEDA